MTKLLAVAIAVVSLLACGSDEGGSTPTAPAADRVDGNTEEDGAPEDGPGDLDPQTGDDDPAVEDEPADDAAAAPAIKVVGGLTSVRDLIFGPAGSGIDDELFVVHFTGVEATWVRNFGDQNQSLQRIQNSLVGAIAVDIDSAGRFYFACLSPVMGDNIGVITVREFDSSVSDFQYIGVSGPTGVALNADENLFVFNRVAGSVSRLDFSDGSGPDQHAVEVIAGNLIPGPEELPNHMAVDQQGRLFICETGANRLQVWDSFEGLRVFAEDLDLPVGVALRPDGRVLVSNHGDGKVAEFDAEGTSLRRVDTELGGGRIYGIAVRGDDSVFIAEDSGSSGGVWRIDM